MDTGLKKHWPYLVFIAVMLLLGFSPAIVNVFPFHDDIYLWEHPFSPQRFPMMCTLTLYVGRVIGAMILWAFYAFIKTVPDLNTIRLLNILVIICCACEAYGLLLRYLKRPIDAALSAVMLFSLPAFEVWAFHVGQSCEVYAVIFVLIALYALDDRPVLAIVSLLLANLTYPPLAAFYWPMALVLILAQAENDNEPPQHWALRRFYVPGITATLIFALLFHFKKYFIKVFFETAYGPDTLVSNIPDKFFWFFQTVLPQTLNLWNIFPNNIIPALVIAIIAGAGLLTLVKRLLRLKSSLAMTLKILWSNISGGLLLLSSLIVLCYLPNLACAINFNPYRCGEALSALFIVLLIWALKTYCQLLAPSARAGIMTLILSIACFWGIYRCYDNIDRFRARPSSLEYAYLKSSLDHFHGPLKEIYLVPAKFDGLYSYYDEFGVSTYGFDRYRNAVDLISAMLVDIESQDHKQWMSVQYEAPIPRSDGPSFKYFFKLKGTVPLRNREQSPSVGDYSTFEIKIVLGKLKGTVPLKSREQSPSAGTLLIDMNDLYTPLKQIMGRNYNFKVINKGSWSGKE